MASIRADAILRIPNVKIIGNICFLSMVEQPLVGQDLLIIEAS